MIAEPFLKLLRCPEDLSPLTNADVPLVERLNAAIERREIRNKAGRVVEKPADGFLVRADGKIAYPIADDIPLLLIDEGIEL
jgi:uncharacterized protein YbaR (Trm112 family)